VGYGKISMTPDGLCKPPGHSVQSLRSSTSFPRRLPRKRRFARTAELTLDPRDQGGKFALPVGPGLTKDRLDLIPHRLSRDLKFVCDLFRG
jgi:hypothetical protein